MTWGTSHFISRAAAERYYRLQGGEPDARQAVTRKLAEGLIHIGPPELKPNQRLIKLDGGLRFGIEETDRA